LEGSLFKASLGKYFTTPHLSGKKLGVVAYTCHPSNIEKHKTGKLLSECLGKKRDAISKVTRVKRASGMAEAIEYLSIKDELPNSNLSTAKKKKKVQCCTGGGKKPGFSKGWNPLFSVKLLLKLITHYCQGYVFPQIKNGATIIFWLNTSNRGSVILTKLS
jgi:aminopeptidase-like protein